MSTHDDYKLTPRNGHTLKVGIVARISGGQYQKELSLDDQIDHAKEVVADLYDGPVVYVVFSTVGKGELLERPELQEIETALRSRTLDLLVMEDLGRFVRGVEAVWLLGIGVDHGVRGISPNDGIDTIEPTWEEDALAACREHVSHNTHTSKRMKYKMMNRFRKQGGSTPRPIAGYVVPVGAQNQDDWRRFRSKGITFDDWQKVETATPTIQAGLKLLRQTLNCSTVGDYFNCQSFERGLYAKLTPS